MNATLSNEGSPTVTLSSKKFLLACVMVAAAILIAGPDFVPSWLLPTEVFFTILLLFVFGSIRYRIDKNAVTYGMAAIIAATFWTHWWPTSSLSVQSEQIGWTAFPAFIYHHFMTLEGLNHLIHADTMLFILGLTFFVAVIAETRLLESISSKILNFNKGRVLPTFFMLTAIVSVLSGILDGVSMIGLMIRILVMILFLAKAKKEDIVYVVMISTIITTVCGMWLAYGEPPNLIMKANLHPYLDNAFFIRYCMPVAVLSFLVVQWSLRKRLKHAHVDMAQMDILDKHMDDVRFLQAFRHGKVFIPTEFINDYAVTLGERYSRIEERIHTGEPLGAALIREGVEPKLRLEILGKYIAEDLAAPLDKHYQHLVKGELSSVNQSEIYIRNILASMQQRRKKTQWVGCLAFIPFIGGLIWHGMDHSVPLFISSISAFLVAFVGIQKYDLMRKLALQHGKHEYAEYLFLIPLFFSISLLQKSGFFDQLSQWMETGLHYMGPAHLAYLQFTGAAVLSALLDNNVVADFASHALHGLEISVLHLFAMAQIAGYAVGGCWTHIGSAQSVVAYAFIRKEVDPHYTPFQWMKVMTGLIFKIFLVMTLVVYGEAALLPYLQ